MYSQGNATAGGGTMTYTTIPLPKANVWSSHPFRNPDNHQELLTYLQQRLLQGKQKRDSQINRMVAVDKSVSGWLRLSDGDKERIKKQAIDGTPLTTTMSLPLTFVHLDDMMTYFAQTFSPSRGMFYQTGNPKEQDSAGQIVTLMNNHAIYAGYFREVLQGLYAILKYNRGGFHLYWASDKGPKISKNAKGEDVVDLVTRWQGNKLEALDPYNHLYDPAVHPSRLYCDGEFTAVAKAKSFYWLQKKASQGLYFNCDEALEEWKGDSSFVYYVNPPQEANFQTQNSQGRDDWVGILSQREGYSTQQMELVEIYININPTDFGLVEGNATAKKARDRYETWRFTVLNDKYIIEATSLNNVHGYLPHFIGLLNDDSMGSAQKSIAEILQPMQNFASSLLNTHIQANRKKLWGLTVYDPTIVNLKDIPDGEVSARIPMSATAAGKKPSDSIWQADSTLDTKQTMGDLKDVMDIINGFFPTQSLPNQIASIDRAIDSQVAAVQQGANRRQQKAGRLLDETIFRPVRFAAYYNIIQYQPDAEEVTDYYTGQIVQINLDDLRNTDLPFIIGQGLKSIDRQAAAKALQGIIFAMIQAPQASQGVDLLGLINFWTQMQDIDCDMEQFRLPPPTAAGPGAGEAAPAAPAGNAIQPATAPGKITTPIYGGGAGQ